MVLVMKEPDLGTALTYLPILVLWHVDGRPAVEVSLVLVGFLVVTLPIGYHFLKPYQKDRLVSFIYPDRDPKGTGFQVIQSRIAVGNGGMWGRGAKESSQTHLGFLPVPHTDFIFSSFAEEHGFVGVVIALVLYFLLIMQVVQNAQTATDRAGLYICMGVAALVAVSRISKCRYGGGPYADYRNSASADEFGGVEYVVGFSDAGPGE